MKGFFRRLSVVTSWIGFGLACTLAFYEGEYTLGAVVWFGVGVINYILSGSLRLLPWLKLEE